MRRVSIATHQGAEIPDDYVRSIRDLADAIDVVARAWAENKFADFGRLGLIALGERTRLLDRGEYHTTILLGQLRSLVVDLLELTGVDHEEAVTLVPPLDGYAGAIGMVEETGLRRWR